MTAGISGHQKIAKYDIFWIENELNELIIQKKIDFGFSSLALGADQLFVEILLRLNIPYEVIVPSNNYEDTFKTESQKAEYYSYLKNASRSITLRYDQPSEDAFYAAGRKIVEFSDILFAVWDGKKAKGLGGTGDIVKYAQNNLKPVFHINPQEKIVNYLSTD